MLNFKRKCIFIHIPKTSGTSIKNTIGDFSDSVGYHAKPSDIKNKHPKAWESFFKFTIVRNPFDRCYSIYSYYKMGRRVTLVDSNVLPSNFEAFVLDLENNLKKIGYNYNQVDFLNEQVDYVGRFEELDDSFDEICKNIELEGKKLSHDRVSKRKANYREVYTPEMVEIVKDYFNKDIDTFGYEF